MPLEGMPNPKVPCESPPRFKSQRTKKCLRKKKIEFCAPVHKKGKKGYLYFYWILPIFDPPTLSTFNSRPVPSTHVTALGA